VTEGLPQPMACEGVTTHDPATRSLSVKVSGFGASFWRRGHARMMAEAGRFGEPVVYANAPGRPQLSRGEPVEGGWLRFKLSHNDYRQLVGSSAIATVDKRSGAILGVRFRGRP
jgi:hypothetical protein